jgi:glycosyltransferase involved in cell wall biosynthesis
MGAEPLVSVLMPAYNCAPYIGAAIESILAQSYPHFELLVVDDGSADETLAIAAAYCQRDHRVQVHPQAHAGIAGARNRALELARGEFCAWLDADDLARPDRLESQVGAFRTDPRRAIAGSAYQVIDDQGVPQGVHKMPETDTMIRWHCLFHSPFAQSSVMLRLDMLRAQKLDYDPTMPPAEDYDVWSRFLQYGRGYNLSEPLVSYRVHPAQASQQGQRQLREQAGRVAQRNLIALGMPLTIEQVQRLREWYYHFPRRFGDEDQPLAEAWLDILNRFSLQPGLDEGEVARLRGRWLGRLLRAGLRSRDTRWGLRLLRRLKPEDLRVVINYLRRRDKAHSW